MRTRPIGEVRESTAAGRCRSIPPLSGSVDQIRCLTPRGRLARPPCRSRSHAASSRAGEEPASGSPQAMWEAQTLRQMRPCPLSCRAEDPCLKPRESPLAGDMLIVAAEQVALLVDDHGAATLERDVELRTSRHRSLHRGGQGEGQRHEVEISGGVWETPRLKHPPLISHAPSMIKPITPGAKRAVCTGAPNRPRCAIHPS